RRDEVRRDGRRDRRRRGGEGGGLHRDRDDQARRRLHRRLHRATRQDDGACGGDHLRVVRHSIGKAEGARGARDPGRHDADRDRSARGRAHHLTHAELVEVVRGTSCTTTARDDARAVVGGVGGRLAMLLLRITSPDHVVGMTSDDGFEIGVVSADTLQLVLAMALLGGIHGIVYEPLRSAIPRRLRLVLWTVFAAALGGARIVHEDGVDFAVLEPAALAVVLFVVLPGAAAALVVVLVERGSLVEPWADRRLSAGLCAAALAGS